MFVRVLVLPSQLLLIPHRLRPDYYYVSDLIAASAKQTTDQVSERD
jgi:hypothetical protein